MQRRTMLGRLGVAGAAVIGFSGRAAASGVDFGIDRVLDVSDLEGTYPIADLLDDEDLEALNDEIDPHELKLKISPGAESFDAASGCGGEIVIPIGGDLCATCCNLTCFCPVCCCVNC